MLAGSGFTVIKVVALQPEPNAYVMVTTPGATPVTPPVASIDAMLLLLLLQVPPATELLREIV
jgi:hypothetical protein